MGKLADLQYPKKSHRKVISIPPESEQLAAFFGIMLGDGGINNDWQANITLNAVADANYTKQIVQLIECLFSIQPAVRVRSNSNARIISTASTELIEFLTSKGLPKGNKLLHRLAIPSWVMAKSLYRVACVRGLVDTNGCLYVHSHSVRGRQYENIGFCFTSFPSELIKQVPQIFEEFGIFPHISNHGRSIYLYKAEAVAKYLEIFNTSNPRISNVYEKWRRG